MRNEIILSKMLGYTEKILRYCREMDYQAFIGNEMAVEACVFNLSKIGELANKAEQGFRESHPKIMWKELYGLRNRIVHDYDGINLIPVWEVIAANLPVLKMQLEDILEQMQDQ